MENLILEQEPIEHVLMQSLKTLHLEREYNYTLELLHSQYVHTVHDLEQLHKDKVAWYLLHLPKVLKTELVNTMIKRDIHNKDVEHQSEVAHELRVAKYDWSDKHTHTTHSLTSHSNASTASHSTSHSSLTSHSSATSKGSSEGSDWVTSYSAHDKSFYYYNKITGESTWECPDLSKHYEFVDWKIPEIQVVADEEYVSPHTPPPPAGRQKLQHINSHNHHLHTHKAQKEADSDKVETRPSTLVDASYHPKKKIHHPSLTLLERMRSLKIFTQKKLAE